MPNISRTRPPSDGVNEELTAMTTTHDIAAGRTAARTRAEEGLAEAFAALSRGRGHDAVAARRHAAFAQFQAHGLPHRRVEEWKYTDLRSLVADAKPLATAADAAARARAAGGGAVFAATGARRIVLVDGALDSERSDLADLEAGLTVTSLADVLGRGGCELADRLAAPGPAEGDVAYALNTAFMGDGAVIAIAAGTRIARPIHLVFVHGSDRADAVFSRSLVVLGEGAGVTLLQSHEGPRDVDYQVNTALDAVIADHACLDRVTVNAEGAAALHVATLSATVGSGAKVSDFTLLTGGAVTRNQMFVRLVGEGTVLRLAGASLLTGRQHGDTTLFVDHGGRACEARELFKSVLDGAARGVFQGKIMVRPDAMKTDARMMARALILSGEAEAFHKPELEIFADDVQCGHGATSGALDENLRFYLMSRGIPEREAEALLIQSFVGEAIDTVADAAVRDALSSAATRWLEGRRS